MLVKMIAVVLVLTITGLRAEDSSKNLVSAFLDYATQVSSATKNSASATALFDLSKQVSDLLEKNIKNLNIENLQENISIFASNMNKLTYDKAQQPMLDELERLKGTLSASALEVNNLFNIISEELLVKLTLYFEDLRSKVEKNALAVNKKLESITLDFNTKLTTTPNSMQSFLNLQNLESTVLINLEEVRVNLNVYSEMVNEKLAQQSLMLVNNLSPYAADMQESLQKTFEAICVKIKKVVDQMQTTFFVKASQLKEQVSFFKSSVVRNTYLDVADAKKTTFTYLIDLSQKTLLVKDAVALYGDIIKKALVEGLEDMKKMMALYTVQVSTKILDRNIQDTASLNVPYS